MLIVLLLPLLLLGFVFWIKIIGEEKYAFILCEPSFGSEDCRNLGTTFENPIFKSVQAEHPSWVDIHIPNSHGVLGSSEFVQLSERIIRSVRVIGVQSLLGSAKIPRNLVGELAMIHFGNHKNDQSIIDNAPIFLSCNDLRFYQNRDIYSTHCYGNAWSVEITFDASGAAAQELNETRAAIDKEVNRHQSEYFWVTALLISTPFIIFLLVSVLVWTTAIAISYVRST